MKKLAILGLGHVGKFVHDTLKSDYHFAVSGYDLSTGHDLSDENTLRSIIKEQNGVLASTPFFLNKKIAELCDHYGVDYFDLTESVEVTDYVKTLNNARFVTQCGLAPGMVSIIANNIAKEFDSVKDIEIRVGALPQHASNHLQYYKTWNTEGLINEYIHACPAIKNGELAQLEPLADLESVTIDGIQLEAANTSGGLGSLADSYLGLADNVNYKTLRYPGHWAAVRFLKDDLNMKDNFDTFVKIFNASIPSTSQDCVYILISVKGYIGGHLRIKQYTKTVYSDAYVTAIQRTTAGGVMAVLDSWAKNSMPDRNGWIRQEQLDFDSVWASKYAECYR